MEENNNIPAAGEQVVFNETPKTEEPRDMEPQNEMPKVEEPQAQIPQPEVQPQAQIPQPEVQPQAQIPQAQIPQPEAQPQQQYQQVPPMGTYQYQGQGQNQNQNQYQNQYQNQQQYQQVPPTMVTSEPDKTPMTMGDWLVTMLLMMIPCVNIVLLFVWAFGDKTGNLNRRNYSRAMLIILGILFALYILLIIIMTIAIGASYAY